MRILVLDDVPERHTAFAERLLGEEVSHVYVHQSAVAVLKVEPAFDRVYLDHDLGTEATGYDTAKFIAFELPKGQRPKLVVVHTNNPIGGDRMLKILQDGGVDTEHQPFRA